MPESDRIKRAEQYRFRAEELRSICASWIDTETRAMLSRVANDYDRMAAHLEREIVPTSH